METEIGNIGESNLSCGLCEGSGLLSTPFYKFESCLPVTKFFLHFCSNVFHKVLQLSLFLKTRSLFSSSSLRICVIMF